MAKQKRKKIMVKRNLENEVRNGIFGKFKFTESYTSLILGAIVVLVAGILFVSFVRGNRSDQTSSIKKEPKTEEQKSQEESDAITTSDSKTSSIYTIKPGDDLWSISENVYSNGYRWIEIAKINKLEDPGLIHVGNKLMIPTILEKESVVMQSEVSSKKSDKIVENNSIVGNTYTIKSGDNLWDISVRAYGDGFKWPEIAKTNNLENPDLIFSDNILQIPK